MVSADMIAHSLKTLLSEALDGGKPEESWFINRTDPGLIHLLRSLSALEASTPPAPGRMPIVAHAEHLRYHLSLIEATLRGEADAFATANWATAWELREIRDTDWNAMIAEIDVLGKVWLEACECPHAWDQMMLTGAFASIAHLAYHMGAIRQIALINEARD
ncbi:DinB family protein [Blastopirellula marina]|uniref:DinB-like domain-containing protein n=1 Tax=Blastopirellula marina TaxID=124 RepID=A0A2S8GFI6_9BACT|nr:DinB family protein [Blastopirellula marina]PQO30176.1 hypothetical protein C5Y98_21755 [Blastopirellula marina]PQO43227.1 hypothetical protein C5Y93_26365 [Blastopirellula marina]PTL42614.1 DinB family protein [Blastopirellula marina]